MRRLAPFVAFAVALALVAGLPVGPVDADAAVPSAVGDPLGVCEPLDPAHCLLPFPSDTFTVADPATDTGRRVTFNPLALPANVAGKPWDPTEWNRNDGFSPGTPIFAMAPGVDLRPTWGMDDDQLSDLSRSIDPGAPILLIDAAPGSSTRSGPRSTRTPTRPTTSGC